MIPMRRDATDVLRPYNPSRRGRATAHAQSNARSQRLSLATIGLEGELSRRIGLTPLRALYRRLRDFAPRRPRTLPLLEQLDASLLEYILVMLPAARDLCALGACCHHFKRCIHYSALAWEAIAALEGVVGLGAPRRWPLNLPSARARRARAALQLSRRWHAGPIASRGTLRGHKQWVVSLAAAESAGWVVSGSDDGSIRLWDSATCRCRAVVPEAHCMPVVALAAHAPSASAAYGGGHVAAWVASSSGEPIISLWALHSGGAPNAASTSTSASLAAAFVGGDRSPTASPASLRLAGSLIAHTDTVWAVTWLPGGLVASASGDRTICLWDGARVMREAEMREATDGRPAAASAAAPVRGHHALLRAMAADPEAASWPALLPGCQPPPSHPGDASQHGGASALPDTDAPAGGGATGGTPRTPTDIALLQSLQAAQPSVTGGLSAGRSASGAPLRDASTQTDIVTAADGGGGGRDGGGAGERHPNDPSPSICFEALCVLAGHAHGVVALAVCDEYVDAGTDAGTDAADAPGLRAAAAHPRPFQPRPAAAGQRPRLLASGSYDTTIKLWDLGPLLAATHGEDVVDRAREHGASAASAAGRERLPRRSSHTAEALPVPSCVATLEGHAAWVSALTPFGTRLASGSYDGTVRLWRLAMPGADRASQRAMHAPTILRQGQPVTSLCVVGGSLLAAAGYDHCVQIWDPTTATRVHTLRGHEETVWAVAAVGDLCVSGAADNTLRLWAPPGEAWGADGVVGAVTAAAEAEEWKEEGSDEGDTFGGGHATLPSRSPVTTGTIGPRAALSVVSSGEPMRLPVAMLGSPHSDAHGGLQGGAALAAGEERDAAFGRWAVLMAMRGLGYAMRHMTARDLARGLALAISWAICNNPITWALASPEPRPSAVHITLAMAATCRGLEPGRSPAPDGWSPHPPRHRGPPSAAPLPTTAPPRDTHWLERYVRSFLAPHDFRHRRTRARLRWRLDLARALLMGRPTAGAPSERSHTVTFRDTDGMQ